MSKIRVLLVDEQKELVSAIAERLQIRGIDARISLNGESALKMVCDQEPQVMVLDLRIPGIKGLELLMRLKKSHPDLQVIVTTWCGSQRDREAAMGLGAFKYFPKPVDFNELIKTLKLAYETVNR